MSSRLVNMAGHQPYVLYGALVMCLKRYVESCSRTRTDPWIELLLQVKLLYSGAEEEAPLYPFLHCRVKGLTVKQQFRWGETGFLSCSCISTPVSVTICFNSQAGIDAIMTSHQSKGHFLPILLSWRWVVYALALWQSSAATRPPDPHHCVFREPLHHQLVPRWVTVSLTSIPFQW